MSLGDLGAPRHLLAVCSARPRPLRDQLFSPNKRQLHVGGCQNYGPFLGPLNTRCCIISRTPRGTIILITIHVFRSLPPDFLNGGNCFLFGVLFADRVSGEFTKGFAA